MTPKKKRERAHITPEGEEYILSRALEDPGPQRTELAEKLQAQFRRRGWQVPKIETLEGKISKYRNHAEDDPQDKLWSMATLVDYPLPPETIPIVLAVWHNVQNHRSQEIVENPKAGTPFTGPFTIREAQWVARLCFIKEVVTLEHWASAYAFAERVSAILRRKFDSSNMDKAILEEIGMPYMERLKGA